jgi:hypothetical protein
MRRRSGWARETTNSSPSTDEIIVRGGQSHPKPSHAIAIAIVRPKIFSVNADRFLADLWSIRSIFFILSQNKLANIIEKDYNRFIIDAIKTCKENVKKHAKKQFYFLRRYLRLTGA